MLNFSLFRDSYPNGMTAAELLQLEAANEREAESVAEEAIELSREDRFRNQVKDIKNRMELRRMLAEYEAGDLPPPVYNTYNQEMENARGSDYTMDELIPNQYGQPHQANVAPYKRIGIMSEYEVYSICLQTLLIFNFPFTNRTTINTPRSIRCSVKSRASTISPKSC